MVAIGGRIRGGRSRPRGHGLTWAFGIALAAVMISTPIVAIGAPAVAEQTAAGVRDFDIPRQSLAAALRRFAEQSGMQLAYTTAEVAGLQSASVRSRLTAEQALTQLLGGTGISYRFTGQNTIALRSRAQTQGVDVSGAISLEAIDVTASSESAWGPVDGYVATRSAAGSKSDTSIVETPQSVSVVSRDQMRDRQVQTVVEALQYTPGVNTHQGGKDPRFDQVTIRGFSAQGNGVYRDGLRELGDANLFAYPRTDPYSLERIDVLRGPASVLYGQTGPGGVIDKISKRPTAEPLHEIVGLVGNYNRYQGAFDLGGPVDKDKQLLFRLTGLIRDSDEQIAHFSEYVKDDRKLIAPAVTWQPNSDTKITVLAGYQHDITGNAFPVSAITYAGGAVTKASPIPVFLGDPNWNKFDHTQYRIGYEFEHRIDDTFKFNQKLRYSYVDLDYRYLTGFPINGATTFSRTANWVLETGDSLGMDNQLHAKLNTGPFEHNALFGLDYQRLNFDEVFKYATSASLNINNPVYYQSITAPTTVRTSTQQNSWQIGAYAQDQIKLQNWLLTLGSRYDWASLDSNNRVTTVVTQTEDEAFTKRIGLTYLFASGVAPYASYSESFLPTTGTDFSGGPFKPTKGKQMEAGIKYQPPGLKMLLTLAAFDIKQKNVLTTDPDHANFSVQTGAIRSRGVEAQATMEPVDGLKLIASVTQMKIEVTESNKADLGNVPIVTPERMASVWADYTIQSGPLVGFGFGAGARYNGKTYMDLANTSTNDPYTVVDAALHYELKGMRLGLNVSNLFNKQEAICSTSGGCQYISPRVVMMTARYKW